MAVYRDSLTTLLDSIALEHVRDSIRKIELSRVDATLQGERPGRKFLVTSDTSLFANHTGSVGPDYPLGPGDGLILTIWGQKQARYELEIDRDGQVQLPGLGLVSLNGASFGDAKKIFSRRLATIYSGINSGTTQFDLTMQKLKQIRVFVLGEVQKPGGYLLSGNISSLQALALSGGPTKFGSERTVIITRGEDAFTVDLYAYLFLGKRPKRDVLQDGDILRIPPANGTVSVQGASGRPGRYEVIPGETLADVLAYSAGFAPDLEPDLPLRLVRSSGGSRTSVLLASAREIAKTSRTIVVQSDDVIQIPSKPKALRASPVVTGGVRNPGAYPYSPGLTVSQLVHLAGGPSNDAFLSRVILFRFDSTGTAKVLRMDLNSRIEMPVFPTDSVVVPQRDLSETDTSLQVEIYGAVKYPGRHPWKKGMQAKDLVLLAGGFLPSADTRYIRIDERDLNGVNSKSSVVAIDTGLRIESGDQSIRARTLVDVPFLPGMAATSKIKVTGLVQSPGTYAILAPNEKISAVVRRAGGLAPGAYPQGAVLWRPSEGRIPFDLQLALKKPGSDDNVMLLGGDSLFVPATPATVTVAGRVNHPTKVLWRDGESWKWYVNSAGGFADSANLEGVYVQYADGSIRSYDQGLDDPTPGSTVFVPRKDPPRTSTTSEKISAFGTILTAIATVLTVYVLYVTQSD
ncbi:MAG TPA: SLBB domain-containing protein [Fibrobacteria bacterium]|nr:SLBB domain-containing protein [Fibrobacteria bacterium]